MTDIEIPWAKDRNFTYKFFEKLPGLLTYSLFIGPLILSWFAPGVAAFFLVSYVLSWVFKSVAISIRVLQGHKRLKDAQQLDWQQMTQDLFNPAEALETLEPVNKLHKGHGRNLKLLLDQNRTIDIPADEIIQAVVVATYNEPPEVINPTVESVLSCIGVNDKNTAFFLAYEERTGPEKAAHSKQTVATYADKFMHAEVVEHILTDDELAGKGANANNAGKRIAQWASEQGIDPSRVLVTVLDADNRPDKHYFDALTYSYLMAHNRKQKSYQPVALYTNNIWEVPAIMRVSAMANSYFHTANSMRVHALRNFSAHTQSLDALLDTNFWSARTIVEDGHQFWRSYFTYDGDYSVIPLYVPIYQDAVLAGSYRKTLAAQFKQIRRWTYGASDIAYVATRTLKNKKVSKPNAIAKFFRLMENHVGWATSAPLILASGWIPLIANPESSTILIARQLPNIIGRINTIALGLLLITVYVGVATLPRRPDHHGRKRYFAFAWQWLLVPFVGLVFNSYAALTSQTRLLFGRYLERFDVTEKVVKKGVDQTKSSSGTI